MKDGANEANEKWTLIVKPKSGWFDLHLTDLWHYRDLLTIFVKRDFAATYKQTILGPLWFFLQPLFTSLIFIYFQRIAKIDTDGIPPMLFNLSGLTMWNYFSSCVNKTSATFVSNAGIFGKVYFPRLITPLSTVVSNLISFAMQFLLFIIFFVYFMLFRGFTPHLNTHLLAIPLLIIIMAGLGLSVGMIVSSLTTKYRDLSYLITFGIQLLMYLTPTIFPLSLTSPSSKKRLLVMLNPMTSVIEGFRNAFFSKGIFNWYLLGYSTAFMLIALFIGILLFNRTEKNFMDTV
ncbi:MAG TPA: ABC transporter permease [Bacteroidia bacterium]|nr:ABC transporter permease [Bacteroidia bacterium]